MPDRHETVTATLDPFVYTNQALTFGDLPAGSSEISQWALIGIRSL